MDPVPLFVLLALVGATVLLFYYTRWYLPRVMDERFDDSLKAFSRAIELRFPAHQGYTVRVLPLSTAVARRLGLEGKRLQDLRTAAQLRDIGLCAVPYSLVNGRDMASWSLAEQATYDRHQEVSAAMLELVPSLRHLATIVRCHHADYDGSDGPYFPVREALPLESRILKVVVEYVRFESVIGTEAAQERVDTLSGSAYDPRVVAAFNAVLTSTRVGESPRTQSMVSP